MDKELAEMIKEITSIITGNTFDTLTKEDYKRLESLALSIGNDSEIINV